MPVIKKSRVLVIDVDGTLCPIKEPHQNYADLMVEPRIRRRLVELKQEGWHIILSSSRGMRTYDGDAGQINANVLPVLLDWLKRNDVPFDEIQMAKPWPGHDGFYVDDRTVRPREFLEHSFEELNAICERDRVT
jgi:capsule biosynthesis phosphatase